jgi:hypothetical protein
MILTNMHQNASSSIFVRFSKSVSRVLTLNLALKAGNTEEMTISSLGDKVEGSYSKG